MALKSYFSLIIMIRVPARVATVSAASNDDDDDDGSIQDKSKKKKKHKKKARHFQTPNFPFTTSFNSKRMAVLYVKFGVKLHQHELIVCLKS